MIGEFERPARLQVGQDRALARYLRNTVAPFSARYGPVLRERPVTGRDGLAALPATTLEDAAEDPADLVLRPTAATLAASPDFRLKTEWWWARLRRRTAAFNRDHLEPAFKPIHWHADAIPIGNTAEDLERIAEAGRAMLEMAGVVPTDVVLSVTPPGPTLAFWQLQLGARRAGVAALFLGPDGATPETVARLRPTVLAGRGGDLVALLEAGRASGYSFAGLTTLLVVGSVVDPPLRGRLADLAGRGAEGGEVAVVAAWAPPGVRALWSECRDGIDVHTWPALEVVEVVDPATGAPVAPGTDGEVVWTPLGWKGSVVLRVATGVVASVDDTPCVSCGRTSPRLRVVHSTPPFARILDEHPQVERWQAELRTADGAEELIVFLATSLIGHPGRLLRELDRQLSVTQFVVLSRAALDDRIAATGGATVIDLRQH